jgi:glyoxylase-like metal-dependent hydrolase (beta-lactamase superfamily II)
MRCGDLELTLIDDGTFRLDGGAMFGVVPRPLWERQKPPDEANRILMGSNSVLVERGSDLLLVDTGLGDKGDDKFRRLFALEEGAVRLPEAIRRAGYELEDITHVVGTHLHFDHCGWNTRRDASRGDRLVPTFPNARYWLERGEVEHARNPNPRDRASYDPTNFEPLFEAGQVELYDDSAEPVPGVRTVKAPGHNRDMVIVLFGTDETPAAERAVFLADLVPTAAHLATPWVMGYDLYPVTTMENKDRWLPRIAEAGWLALFQHDPEIRAARLVPGDRPGRYEASPVEV